MILADIKILRRKGEMEVFLMERLRKISKFYFELIRICYHNFLQEINKPQFFIDNNVMLFLEKKIGEQIIYQTGQFKIVDI